MFDIPARCMVSSRLSNLDIENIRRIVLQASTVLHNSSIQNRIRNNRNTTLLAIGISNPEELKLVIDREIPIIHIQKDCQALRASQKHYWTTRCYSRKMLKLITSGLWVIFGTGIGKIRFKRGHDNVDIPVLSGSIPLPNLLLVGGISFVGILLSLYTKRLINRDRRDYQTMEQEEFILIQDSVRRGLIKYTVQSILPYTVIGLGLFYKSH